MRVLLSGYYGFGNFGDEALLDVIVHRLRERFPQAHLEVLSAAPESTSQTYGVAASPRWPWKNVREAVARADVVLSGGGGLLQNATSLRSLLYYAGVIREGVRSGRKTMIFAQSVGPLDALGRLVVRRFCRGLTRATVRDERSRQLLRSLLPDSPVERTADPAFLFDADEGEADLSAEGLGPESGAYAIVSVRKAPALKDGVAAFARAVDRMAHVHGIRAAFLPLGGVADAEVSTTIIRTCASAPVLLPECSLEKAAAVLRGAHVVIGMRLHALVLAARFGVPFLAVPYDPKVAALCDELQYPLPPLWTPGTGRPDGPAVDASVDQLVAQRDALCAHLAARAGALRASAEKNFDVLAEMLRDEDTVQGETEALP
ncbi:MAG TPA: polysaccharide pyruvyl transferase CsaB [Candidatus Tumulicola sp.]|nr:polysaccharide pyruvyl transferase CsaB [Candidatus Tumulicola sp.]